MRWAGPYSLEPGTRVSSGPVWRLAMGWMIRDRIPVGLQFSTTVQSDLGAHPPSCAKGTGSYTQRQSGQGMALTTHPI